MGDLMDQEKFNSLYFENRELKEKNEDYKGGIMLTTVFGVLGIAAICTGNFVLGAILTGGSALGTAVQAVKTKNNKERIKENYEEMRKMCKEAEGIEEERSDDLALTETEVTEKEPSAEDTLDVTPEI